MAHLYRDLGVKSLYTDRKFEGGRGRWQEAIEQSATLYIGNLSFYTTEEQLYEFFGKTGEVRRVVMGLDRFSKTPCGFCFVEYYRRQDTEDAVRFLNGMKLDERVVRVDWDGGFVEGRQYGRGRSGGQVRDEYRADFDAGRGGWGKADAQESLAPRAGPPSARRRSYPEGRDERRSGGGGGRDSFGRDSFGRDAFGRDIRPPRDEPTAKRSRTDASGGEQPANPRFRADRAASDDEDE